MFRDSKFWIFLAVFQVLFGYAVFAVTRDHYQQPPAKIRAHPSTLSPSAGAWQGIRETDLSRLAPGLVGEAMSQDPAEISRQANIFFANRQYEQAAKAYERLLEIEPENVEVHNNLGLTLHYLGRSTEALRWLNKGVALNAGHQRIWLTLGYVNSEIGNAEEARTALTNATQIGGDESIRQSAQRMLDALP